MEEKIIRQVTEIGNGAHIFAPKEWVGEEVEIIRIPKKDPKQEVLKALYPYLDKVIAVFLFGSYARKEQEKGSDIDAFVISSDKFKVASKSMDIIIIPEKNIEISKKINPILFYSMLNEAKEIINPMYLEKLRKEKINFHYFIDFLKETQMSINSSRELIKMDKALNNKFSSESVIYSLILRLRGIFIINLLLNNKSYSKRLFKEWLIKNTGIDYNSAYEIYRAVRDEKKSTKNIPIQQGDSLLDFLEKERESLLNKIK